jgi:GDP/UDP-N,N'-diacetylbacillosamine 2-epimerase (hydrolysing)
LKKVCVVTGTRAEYGLLRWVMEGIRESKKLDLQLIATGMHLSPEFGLTVNTIETDGFSITRKLEMLLSSDTPSGIIKSMGLGLIGFADILSDLKPDIMVLLGDRFEAFSAAAAAVVSRVPIAHLHGGELTEGLIDESIRHSITKMSHLHFVATEVYRQRVIQLGEDKDRVFNVGGMGIDNIQRLDLLTQEALEDQLGFNFLKKNLIITFHPVTLEKETSAKYFNELLLALDELDETGLIFTLPNADTEGRYLIQQIEKFCSHNKNAKAYKSLGQIRYLSCMAYIDGVIGNSSSGLVEAPSFKKGTINIGDRQRGRMCAASVINCEPNLEAIRKAFSKLFSNDFQKSLYQVTNPYGNGGASKKVVETLEESDLSGLLKKKFCDIKFT